MLEILDLGRRGIVLWILFRCTENKDADHAAAQFLPSWYAPLFSHMSLHLRKPDICICENKAADQLCNNCTTDRCAITTQLISAFVFATRIVQSLYFLNPKFRASSHLQWLHSLVCVGHCREPRRPVFSEWGSYEKSSISCGVSHIDYFCQ